MVGMRSSFIRQNDPLFRESLICQPILTPMIDAYVSTKNFLSKNLLALFFLTAPMLFSHHRGEVSEVTVMQGPTQGLFIKVRPYG